MRSGNIYMYLPTSELCLCRMYEFILVVEFEDGYEVSWDDELYELIGRL